jgi:hypothetical protein
MKKGYSMSRRSKFEFFRSICDQYHPATTAFKSMLLDELCRVCGYNRKYAIRKLNQPRAKAQKSSRTARPVLYEARTIAVLREVWEAAGYPWSVRLYALLRLWQPWIQKKFHLTQDQCKQLLAISPRQMDRRLKPFKTKIRKRIYGRTKPGTLLKHQIPIRTDHWEVNQPGSLELDLVAHSGNSADGDFVFSLNVTDIFSGWVETQGVLGKGRQGVVAALDAIIQRLPFVVHAIDSDNGSEFINDHLLAYCRAHQIQFTRGRPYKKNDNAHVEQKNWTHVRKLLGWQRFDSRRALAAINDCYTHELPVMMNWLQPSVKLVSKRHVGSRVIRRYSDALAPLERLPDSPGVQLLKEQRAKINPFELAQAIECRLEVIWSLANEHHSPKVTRQKPNLGYLFK